MQLHDRAPFYASGIELEITPQPSDAERSAIAAALADDHAGEHAAAESPWRRAGIEPELAVDGYAAEPSL